MIRDLTYLSFRSLTAITLFLNESSPIAFCWWSSHNITLLGGNLGYVPPPTSAKMLHLKSISTIPMPPWKSIIIFVSRWKVRLLTSLELIPVGPSVVHSKTLLSSCWKTTLVLVKPKIDNLIWSRLASAWLNNLLSDGFSQLVALWCFAIDHS